MLHAIGMHLGAFGIDVASFKAFLGHGNLFIFHHLVLFLLLLLCLFRLGAVLIHLLSHIFVGVVLLGHVENELITREEKNRVYVLLYMLNLGWESNTFMGF
ncbi:hypothetical protein V8B55DRAFT_1510975 [Mucor lusitanicus]|uniref:TLC domain-containing protein n=1 Tax=Mucor circinelloides f. lusitanicus TaxID=29924 RepID=A0A8H4BKL0_MUCCL|nr:hypothetical protein FB192DRAFT_1371075 [Mucor lusitanicus]